MNSSFIYKSSILNNFPENVKFYKYVHLLLLYLNYTWLKGDMIILENNGYFHWPYKSDNLNIQGNI